MPTFKIKGGAYQNVDEFGLTGLSPELIDAFVDELDNTVKRPGLALFKDIGSSAAILGLHFWDGQSCIIAVSNGAVYRIDSDGTVTNKTGDPVGTNSDYPPIFASDGSKLWIASGGRMVTLTGSGNSTYVADTDAPTTVTHVAYVDGYILCNSVGTGQFYFTGPTDRTAWEVLDFASAESNPDTVTAVHTFWNEVFLFGDRSVEVWYNDGVNPFSRIPGAKMEMGCVAPYTVCRSGGSIFWINERRQIVKLDARTPSILVCPYQKRLDTMNTIYNAKAFNCEAEGRQWVIFTFPTEDITLAYDTQTQQWARWGFWNSSTQVHNKFKGHCSVVVPFSLSLNLLSSTVTPSTAANFTNVGGTILWTSTAGVLADDASWTCAEFTAVDQKTYFLKLGCTFSIPSTATVTGVKLTLETGTPACNKGSSGNVAFDEVYLLVGGVQVGTNQAFGNISATAETAISFGGQTNNWGKLLTYSDVNGVNFGFLVSGKCTEYVEAGGDTKAPGTIVNDASSGTLAWTSPSSADAEDSTYAFASDTSTSSTKGTTVTSQYILATNFGYSVPTDATILGIEVKCIRNKYTEGNSSVVDNAVYLRMVNLITSVPYYDGINLASGAAWIDGVHTKTYGNSSSIWEVPSITPAHVNHASFGVGIQVNLGLSTSSGDNTSARIDAISMIVYYKGTLGAGIQSASATVYYTTQNVSTYQAESGLLIGDVGDDKLYLLSADQYTDNGSTIKVVRRTGHFTGDTLKRKRSNKLVMRVKKGVETNAVPSPSFKLKWKDDNTDFGAERTISLLGTANHANKLTSTLHRLGIYRSRQYEISHTDATEFMFVEAEEDVEVLNE